MKRGGRGARVLAALACGAWCLAALPGPACAADEASEERSSPWWSWWSWADGWFGLSFGGVRYGDPAHRIIGSDKLVHDARAIAGAHAIEVQGPFDIVLRQGPAERLTLHTDDNIAPLLVSEVRNGTLRLGVRPGAGFQARHAIGATIELPQLESLRILGSSSLVCAQFAVPNLELSVEGSGELRIDSLKVESMKLHIVGKGDALLSGTAQRMDIAIEGTGNLTAPEFSARDVRVRIAGAGNAEVWANFHLDVAIAGVGSVHYRGPATVTQSITGIGTLHRD